MKSTVSDFLIAALGDDGAKAISRAIAKTPELENYLVPRTLLGWTFAKSEYEGVLPGVDLYISFNKTEKGFTGSIGTSNTPAAPFEVPDEYRLVAEIITNMGFDFKKFEGTDLQLARLGRSIDALLKAREAIAFLKAGVDLPGQTAKPQKPKAPGKPEQPTKQPAIGQKPKLPKLPVLKLEVQDADKPCKRCGGKMFKSQKFIGCMCWRDLAKHSATSVYADGIVVEFTKNADKSAVIVLAKEIANE
jgi:hypothetical protein